MDYQQTSISQHYITDNIRKCYKKRLWLPCILLVLFCALWILFPIKELMFPPLVKQGDDLSHLTGIHSSSVEVTLDHLYFTGYTSSMFGRSNGYYYYTIWDGKCIIVLLSPKTCQEGLSTMDDVTIHASIKEPARSIDQLLFNLSADMNWTSDGLLHQMEAYYLDEKSIAGTTTTLFLVLYLGCLIYTVCYALMCLLWSLLPRFSPPVLNLYRFGDGYKLLKQAEQELSTLPQLATEDMFITENFFIEVSLDGVAIVPIQEIIWIYKHSTLHKVLWYHFVISYTLHITGSHHFYIRCPKNIKSDIDGIMDYLSEANHDILVGFNEENRLKVRKIQNRSLQFEAIFEFLKRRI